MPRRGRSSARATRSRRSPTPVTPQPEEEEEESQEVADEVQEDSAVQSPAQVKPEEEQEEEDTVADPDEDPDDVPADSEQGDDASRPNTPLQSLGRPRRGRGRGRARNTAVRQSGWSTPEVAGEEGSDTGTPARRGRGRGRGGGWRGGPRGRGRGKGGPAQVTRVAIDKEGTMKDVIDDEVQMDEDSEGEDKVDRSGNLLGGREYRVRTFTITGRDERLYMLSTEPARCTGFRDSYLFFNKHPSLFKIVIDESEKRDLIDREVIPHSYKGRAIGVVTARSVFREFGCRIVVGGKRVIDDYYAKRSRQRGDVEGELADPYDKIPEAGEKYNRNQYVAWHGASSVYHTQGPNMPMQGGKPLVSGKRKPNITSSNWMFEHAMAASTFNSALNVVRKTTFEGVYDAHTNMLCYPANMQPTHARWERVESPPPSPSKRRKLAAINGGTYSSSFATNGTSDHELPNGTSNHTNGAPSMHSQSLQDYDRFPPPSRYLKNNYLIADVHLSTPPSSLFSLSAVPPSIDTHQPLSDPEFSAGRPAQLGIPYISEAEMDDVDLPEECRQALRDARRAEAEWANQWKGTEALDGSRGALKLGVGLPRDI